MFKGLGLFASIPCPARRCHEVGCLFQHPVHEVGSPAKRLKLETDIAKEVTIHDAEAQLPSCNRHNPGHQHDTIMIQDAALQTSSALTEKTNQDRPRKDDRSVVMAEKDKRKPITAEPVLTIRLDPACRVSHVSRLHYLQAYKTQYERIYAPLTSYPECNRWVIEDSLAQEAAVLKNSGKNVYKQASKNMLIKLTKRAPSTGEDDRGIYPDYTPPLPSPDLSTLVHSQGALEKAGFMLKVPEPDATMKNEEGQDRNCDRCGQRFIVSSDPGQWSTCTHHPGKHIRMGKSGVRPTQWTCCTEDGPGCVVAKSHVLKISHGPRLAAFHPFTLLPPVLPASASDRVIDIRVNNRELVAVDCEMVYTTASMELARVVFTDAKGVVLMDEYVSPDNAVLDLNTRFSGIKDGELEERGIDWEEFFEKMHELGINRETIMVGHGLENDLTAMRLIHTRVIDSALLFPHPRGLPYRNALKYLVKRYLGKDIQMNPVSGENAVGHDPAEDARSALELVIWKAVNGDKKVGDEPFSGKLK